MATIYDSTAASDIPNADDGYVFAYNDGLYTQVDQVRARFPRARIITISAVGQASADVVDVEPGCVWPPASAVAYVARERAAGRNPTVYCGRAAWPSVVQAFAQAWVEQPHYWIAHYTNFPHLCSSDCYPSSVGSLVAVATQYGGDLPGHFDATVTNGMWPDGLAAEGSGTPLATADLGGALAPAAPAPHPQEEPLIINQGDRVAIPLIPGDKKARVSRFGSGAQNVQLSIGTPEGMGGLGAGGSDTVRMDGAFASDFDIPSGATILYIDNTAGPDAVGVRVYG